MANSAASALNTGYSTAYSAGSQIGAGFAAGMASAVGQVQAMAAQLAAAADEAIKAKAKIASPSKVQRENGQFWAEGFMLGIEDMSREVSESAAHLVGSPTYGSAGRNYAFQQERDIHIHLEADGRELAHVVFPYTNELSQREALLKSRLLGGA